MESSPEPPRRNRRAAGILVLLLGIALLLCCVTPAVLFVQHRADVDAAQHAGDQVLSAISLPPDWTRGPVTYQGCGWPHVIGRELCLPPSWSLDLQPPGHQPASEVYATLSTALQRAGWQPC